MITEKVQEGLDPWDDIFSDIIVEDTPEKKEIEETTKEDLGDIFDEIETEDTNSFYHDLAKDLKSKNLLDIDDEDLESIDEEEKFKEIFEKSVEKKFNERLEEYINNLDDNTSKFIKDILIEGKTVDELIKFSPSSDYDLNNEKDQEKVVFDWLNSLGWDEEEINDTIELYKDSDTLRSKAKAALTKLEKNKQKEREDRKEKEKLDFQEAEKRKVETINNIKSKITSSKEIKGFPISDKEKQDLISYISEPNVNYKDPTTGKVFKITKYQYDEIQRSQDLDLFVLKALQSMKNYDLSSIEKKAITRNASKLEEKYKVMIESDSQSKFKQSTNKQLKRDPFEEYLKK